MLASWASDHGRRRRGEAGLHHWRSRLDKGIEGGGGAEGDYGALITSFLYLVRVYCGSALCFLVRTDERGSQNGWHKYIQERSPERSFVFKRFVSRINRETINHVYSTAWTSLLASGILWLLFLAIL